MLLLIAWRKSFLKEEDEESAEEREDTNELNPERKAGSLLTKKSR